MHRHRFATRVVPAVVLFALVTTGLPDARALAELAPANIAKLAASPDATSAMVAARAQKSRVEDMSARTPTSASFANADGTWTTEAYSGIVRSKADDGKWVVIDPTLERVNGRFEPKATPVDVEYSAGGDRTVGVVSNDHGAAVEVGWPSDLPAPRADESVLTYPGAAHGDDLVVESNVDGFQYSVVIDRAPTADTPQLTYRIPLKFEGVTAVVKPDNSIVLRDKDERVGSMTRPVMWDSAPTADDSGATTRPVSAQVEGEGNKLTLVLQPDMEWLRDPATIYPVTVDPQFSFNAAGDTYAESTSSSGAPTSSELRVGSVSLGITKARSYLAFDISSISGVPGIATSAELKMSNFDVSTCSGSAVRVSRVTDPFSIATIKWSNKPASTATGSTTNSAAYGGGSCPENFVTWDATQIVNDARSAGTTTLGLEVKADNETAASGFRKYRSLENGDINKVPTLVVTFNKTPDAATALTVSPGNPGYATSLTPTLSAVVGDPDGGLVRGFFELKSGTTTVWSGSSDWTTSGSRASVTVPPGQLVDGTTYSVNAYSQDDITKSAVPTSSSIKVDVTAPVAGLSATGYSNNTWSTPTANTFTWSGPSDVATYDMVFDGVPLTRAPNSGSDYVWPAIPPVVPNGWHVWEVVGVDKAGNRGPVETLTFGSGYPAFTTPQKNAPSTGSFPIDVSAPPGAMSAYLKWKPKGAGAWTTVTQLTKAGSSWTGAVSTAGGRSTTGPLTWNATSEPNGAGTITAPMTVVVYSCFVYATGEKCTGLQTLQVVPSAFGGNFPTADLGPASVALYTGEAAIEATDAADTTAGIGRSFTSYDAATINGGLFGPGWSSSMVSAPAPGARADVIDNRAKDGTFVIDDPTDGSQTFVSDGGTTGRYVPVIPTGDATELQFTAGSPDRLVLRRPLGSAQYTTIWVYKTSDTGAPADWIFESVDAPGKSLDIGVATTSQRPTWIRESDPAAASTCTLTTQSDGCRGLKITYTGVGSATRVSSIDRVVGAPAPQPSLSTTVATYSYDTSGRLSSVCSPQPAPTKPILCTSYNYVTAGGRTLLSEAKPAGLKAWRFAYDATGRLENVKREKPLGGDAIWSVDYSLSTTSSGLPDVTSSTIASWGQAVAPTKVFAVYAPYSGPASVSKATLFYTTATGQTTNTAASGPNGWLLDSVWYDDDGNVVQRLDPTGWSRAQTAPPGDKLRVASEASSFYSYNAYGDVGTRLVDEYGPLQTLARQDGTVGLYRAHTKVVFDDDPNVDAALIADRPDTNGRGLVVKEVTSIANASRTADFDEHVVKYSYAPVVASDGNGWTLGMPTKVSEQVDATNWSTEVTRFDSDGRVIESRRPGGTANAAGEGNDARSMVTTYYTATGSGDCGGKPQWDGYICKVGPAAGTQTPLSYTSSYGINGLPAVVKEFVGATLTRTTTLSFDGLERLVGRTVQTTGPDVVNQTRATVYTFDDATGLPTGIAVGSQTLATSYDSWGRVSGTADATGNTGARTYDGAGRLSSYSDGVATYTYGYGSAGELQSVDAGGGVGTYAYGYNTNGSLNTVTYPNGVVETRTYDEAGTQNGTKYSQGSSNLLAFTASRDSIGRVVRAASQTSSQNYTYDGLGRLVKAEDVRATGCVTRTYGFDSSSNRTSTTAYAPGASGACQTATSSANRSLGFDTSGRVSSAGYTYDGLGRTLTFPKVDANPTAYGDLTATYDANDRIASLSQNLQVGGLAAPTTTTYDQDPSARIKGFTTTTNGVETSRTRYIYGDSSAGPARVDVSTNGGSSWLSSRQVVIPAVGLVATSSGGAVVQQLSNLQGDVVATMANAVGTGTLLSYGEMDEYGNRVDTATSPPRFGWRGTSQLSTDTPGAALVLAGARVYNPSTGLFAQRDPVPGGGASPYGYPFDPVNMEDMTGTDWKWGGVISASKMKRQGQTFKDVAKSLDVIGSASRALDKAIDWVEDHLRDILVILGLGGKGVQKIVGYALDVLRGAKAAFFFAGYAASKAVDWMVRTLRAWGNIYVKAANDSVLYGSDLARTGWDAGKVWVALAAQSYRNCYQKVYTWKTGHDF